MTQKELAQKLELHKNTVARMERDELPVVKTTELAVRFLLGTKGGKR
jgi:DNA-binding XRE family transcriptional regulator